MQPNVLSKIDLKINDSGDFEAFKVSVNSFFSLPNILEYIIQKVKSEDSSFEFENERYVRFARENRIRVKIKKSISKNYPVGSLKEKLFMDEVISSLTREMSKQLKENDPSKFELSLIRGKIGEEHFEEAEFILSMAMAIITIDTSDSPESEIFVSLLYV